jgi:hypothetical protein
MSGHPIRDQDQAFEIPKFRLRKAGESRTDSGISVMISEFG